MNQNESNNSASNSQKKYIKLNVNSILKGGAEDLPSPYIEETAIVDHPYKEQAYDLGANNENCKQTGGAIALPVDPFADHNPMNPLLSPGFPRIITNVPQVDKLYPINGPNGGVGLTPVSPMSYGFNPHSFPSNDIQNIKIPLLPSNYMLPGPITAGPFISSIGYSSDSLRSHQLKNYLRSVVATLERLLTRRKYANRFERVHINEQINRLSQQLSRVSEVYKPTKKNTVKQNIASILVKIKALLR